MRTQLNTSEEPWIKSDTHVFWGEIAPADHIVQIYESDAVILDSLEGFVVSGLKNEECVIIVATAERLKALDRRLSLHGFNLDDLKQQNCYVTLDAENTLDKFMIEGWPNERLFNEVIRSIVNTARGPESRKIRVYGEMVALLWAQGHNGATVQLEHLWNEFCKKDVFCLFCAYPKSGFTQDVATSIGHICSAHTKLIDGDHASLTEVFYKNA